MKWRAEAGGRGQVARAFVALLTLVLLATSFACAEEDTVDTQDIVAGIPWRAPETAAYVIVESDDKDEVIGRAVLSIEERDGQLVLTQSFSDDEGNTDESAVRGDATTVKPISVTRTIRNEEERTVAEATYDYDEDLVRIMQSNFEPPDATTPQSTRGNPLRLPDHAYDNHTSLFLWRTIIFEEDRSVTYASVLSNVREMQKITLTVAGQDRVDTPAGEFDAWHLEITTEQGEQDAWFSTDQVRRLLVYDNGNEVFLFCGQNTDCPPD